jgi:hypothetical protein
VKADFSRNTFRPRNHYSRVLQQQGRPLLDADWNEQVAIFSHRLQMLTADLMGGETDPSGAPVTGAGFEINAMRGKSDNFTISRGRYYVEGLCCECDEDTSFSNQPLSEGLRVEREGVCLVYLDVWESLVTPADDPGILEPALAGVQTTVRARVCWQVKAQRLSEKHDVRAPDFDALKAECEELTAHWRKRHRGLLRTRLAEPINEAGRRPTQGSRAARFRGPENLMYRVEVHKGGPAGEATFKWSRDNGAQLLPLASLEGGVATLAPLSRRAAAELPATAWLEISDSESRALSGAEPMARVKEASGGPGRIELTPPPPSRYDFKPGARRDVALRRWDQQSEVGNRGGDMSGPDGLPIVEGEQDAHWFDIEDGIQIQFVREGKQESHYRQGDYWLIPARTADEGVLLRGAEPMPPDGVQHYYAPLALFVPLQAEVIADYRQWFKPLASLQDQVTSLSDTLDELIRRVAALEGQKS